MNIDLSSDKRPPIELGPSLELKNSKGAHPSTMNEIIVSLSNENADVPDITNSNRKFDVSLVGTLLSHTTNLNALVLSPAVRICPVRTLKERKYQLPVAIFYFRDVKVQRRQR